MKTIQIKLYLLFFAVIFTFLFYHQWLGINLLIFEMVILVFLVFTKQITIPMQRFLSVAVLITVLFSVINHATWTYFINFLLVFVLIGSVTSPEIRLLPLVLLNAVTAFFKVQLKWPNELFRRNQQKDQKRKRFKNLKLLLIPLLIITLFTLFYCASNPKFAYYFSWMFSEIGSFIERIFGHLEFEAILMTLLGFVFAGFVVLRAVNKYAIQKDAKGNDALVRMRLLQKRRLVGSLKNEYKSALFLFLGLNVLLAFLNSMDIYWVWFHFKWEGQFLKDFVHQGTYLLIISIVISIGLVLYFFRKNLNFYSKNSLLKKLTYLWLIQNAVLVISVAIRNWYYIEFYALAYKRIAIVFFLIFVLVILVTVYLKVAKIKSNFYLFRLNSYALILILISSTLFNWDRIIATYNFSKAQQSFVHLNYLATLSNSALPALNVPFNQLVKLDQKQMNHFVDIKLDSYDSGSSGFYRRNFMSPKAYKSLIWYRIKYFKQTWKQKGWLSWNYAEQKAYDELITCDFDISN